MEAGILYLVATPIGNLEDMTMRAIRVLGEVDIIAAEDTRNSIKLLNHFEIKKPMTSYHEFNRFDKAHELVGKLLAGESVALISDAGTPGISDPGEVLVAKCIDAGVQVVPIPGAVAGINALIASGQCTRRFVFEGFLPAEKKERDEVLGRLKDEMRTIILYEAPHRLVKTLELLVECFGEARSITICKELTKKHERFEKMTLGEAVAKFSEDGAEEPRGEYVLVIAGLPMEEKLAAEKAQWEDLSVEEHLRQVMETGVSKKEAIKLVAKQRGVAKQEIYKIATDLDF